jgi:hypothetical protein
MTRDETVALFLQGREAWNAWAENTLAERKAMEADGRWAAGKNQFAGLQPANEETSAWMQKALADFSRCLFLVRGAEQTKETPGEEGKLDDEARPAGKLIQLQAENIDFSGFIFPGFAQFVSTAFCGRASFDSATFSGYAWFGNANFSGAASFDSATFSGNSGFGSATFSGGASFGCAAFTGDARFTSATFSGTAWFTSAVFSGTTSFDSSTFTGEAWFVSTIFSGYASFVSATFCGATRFESAAFSGGARFQSAAFQNSTNCREVKLLKETSFTGIKVDRTFDMTGAVFKQIPAFNQADFKQAPGLDNVAFPPPPFWATGDVELIAKYRALRRMAIQGADYERGQMAFKGELRSRRWTTDKWWHFGTWFGLLYDGLADCGRSIVRPLLIWLASMPVFAVLYFWAADRAEEFSCGMPFVKALFLSGRNAFVLFSGGRDARIAQAYRCLYGGNPEPSIPDSVSYLEAFVQVPISAVLIFLLLLAIKSRFKIK